MGVMRWISVWVLLFPSVHFGIVEEEVCEPVGRLVKDYVGAGQDVKAAKRNYAIFRGTKARTEIDELVKDKNGYEKFEEFLKGQKDVDPSDIPTFRRQFKMEFLAERITSPKALSAAESTQVREIFEMLDPGSTKIVTLKNGEQTVAFRPKNLDEETLDKIRKLMGSEKNNRAATIANNLAQDADVMARTIPLERRALSNLESTSLMDSKNPFVARAGVKIVDVTADTDQLRAVSQTNLGPLGFKRVIYRDEARGISDIVIFGPKGETLSVERIVLRDPKNPSAGVGFFAKHNDDLYEKYSVQPIRLHGGNCFRCHNVDAGGRFTSTLRPMSNPSRSQRYIDSLN